MNSYDNLSKFVQDICSDRDPSHGHSHMKQVTKNSLDIFANEINNYTSDQTKQNYLKDLVMHVAWLHDVADHKYDKDGSIKKKVKDYLVKTVADCADLIENIIDRISYSKENMSKINNIKLDWPEVLGADGCFVRNIVSDADKLEALGKVGLDRCVQYIKEKDPTISYEQLVTKVNGHANEKLLRLADEFIVTPYGKKLAEKLHDELIDALNNFTLDIV